MTVWFICLHASVKILALASRNKEGHLPLEFAYCLSGHGDYKKQQKKGKIEGYTPTEKNPTGAHMWTETNSLIQKKIYLLTASYDVQLADWMDKLWFDVDKHHHLCACVPPRVALSRRSSQLLKDPQDRVNFFYMSMPFLEALMRRGEAPWYYISFITFMAINRYSFRKIVMGSSANWRLRR